MRAWLDDFRLAWPSVIVAAMVTALLLSYDASEPQAILGGGVAWIVVGLLDDLCALVNSLHACVHEAAQEALREADREKRPETQAQR